MASVISLMSVNFAQRRSYWCALHEPATAGDGPGLLGRKNSLTTRRRIHHSRPSTVRIQLRGSLAA